MIDNNFNLCEIAHKVDGINFEDKDFRIALNKFKAIPKNKRILFVLKDYYSNEKSVDQNLYLNQDENPIESIDKIAKSYNEYFKPLRFYITRLNDKKNGSSFSKVAKVASVIFNGETEETNYKVDSSFNNYTRKIAYININKELWYNNSTDKHVSSAYRKYKDILLAQIEIIDPGIIIFGGTFKFFYNDLNDKYHLGLFKNQNIHYRGNNIKFAPYVSKLNPKKFILFEVCHPRQWNLMIPDLFLQSITDWCKIEPNKMNILEEWTKKDIYITKTKIN